MLTCDEATRLIVHDTEGVLDSAVGERLRAHLAQCSACRIEADTQALVKDVLHDRPAEALPIGFEARLSARLTDENRLSWLELINWRTWSMALFPAAAIVLALAGSIGRSAYADPQLRDSLSSMLADGSVADVLFNRGDDSEALIDEALLGRANRADGRRAR